MSKYFQGSEIVAEKVSPENIPIRTTRDGTKYYITKNSWGAESNKSGGYLNMSESYVRAKTICVMVHKDSLPKELKQKLGIR